MSGHDAEIPDRETLEQLVALDVYGELEPAERARLDAALATSPELRRYADSMRATLGHLANEEAATRHRTAIATGTKDEEDDAWTREVRRAIEAADARPTRRIPASIIGGAIGFAAGLAIMAAVQASDPAADPKPHTIETTAQAIERDAANSTNGSSSNGSSSNGSSSNGSSSNGSSSNGSSSNGSSSNGSSTGGISANGSSSERGSSTEHSAVASPRGATPMRAEAAFERATTPPRARLGSLARLGVYLGS